MDKAVEDARKAGSQPFSGVTLSCTESLPISRLRSALNSIVDAAPDAFSGNANPEVRRLARTRRFRFTVERIEFWRTDLPAFIR